MKRDLSPIRISTVAACVGCLAILAFAAIASAASTTMTFTEPEKDSTGAFVDNAPKSKRVSGVPQKFSAGDEIIFTGKYAGARGTFVVVEHPGSDTNTITLLE